MMMEQGTESGGEERRGEERRGEERMGEEERSSPCSILCYPVLSRGLFPLHDLSLPFFSSFLLPLPLLPSPF
jgi:hypothetical protein